MSDDSVSDPSEVIKTSLYYYLKQKPSEGGEAEEDASGKANDGKRETDDGSEPGAGKRNYGTGEADKRKRADGE